MIKLYIYIKNKRKKCIIIFYIMYIFENTNILSINLSVVVNMQINLHFD